MSDLNQRIASLSPEKRKLLEMRLMGQKSAPGDNIQVISRRKHSSNNLLSFAQQRLWILNQLEPDSSAYNIIRAVKIEGALNVAFLEKALSAIADRHATLRTNFDFENGIPVQIIKAHRAIDISTIDLSKQPISEREKETSRLLKELAQRPFNLSKDPMLRATLLRLSEKEHILLLVMHHIASDGWSIDILYRELATLYKGFLTGESVSLLPLPIQYTDYAHWQRQWLQGEVLESQLSYWKQALGGDLPVLELPTDHPRSVIQTFRGERRPLILPTNLADELRRLSRQEGVTLFMTLLAAFQALLHRYTGQDDIMVGCPTANRNRLEIEGLIGFFVNTLVLRTDITGQPSFKELLKQVREATQAAYDHQDLPFEKLVEELRPERDLSRNPLFQVMFVFQNVPQTPLELPGLKLTPIEVDPGTAMFELSLYMWEDAAGLSGFFEFNTDLFDTATIDRLAAHFQNLLEGIVKDPERPVSDLPILSEAERHQLLVEWNNTRADYPEEFCIHELFEAQVQRTPEKVSVIFKDEELTYIELSHRANQLAHYLQKLGVGPEAVVGVCVERSTEMVTGLLGILKAGGAYLPLDPTYPKERLELMLKDSQVSVLLTQSRLLDVLPEFPARIVCLDKDWKLISKECTENPNSGVQPHNPAYLIYTSGSTGTPKGVLGLHRGAVNRFHWMWRTYPFEAGEICCQKTTLSFVDSIWEIFGPLLQGIKMVILPDEVVKDAQLLVQSLAAHKVSRIVLVPSLLRVILETHDNLQNRLSALKIWVTSGEEISAELANRFFKAMPLARFINLYGSSEVSADATCYEIKNGMLNRCIPIGRPIDNTSVYILDSNLKPLPIGVFGELHIGGAGLAGGYYHRRELSAEKFISNPFKVGEVIYKTGDYARYLPDGNIEYSGRLDHQVKIRGYRIELAEIEEALKQYSELREAVAVAWVDERGEKRLVAYVVSAATVAPSANQLRLFLKERLPDYMVPSVFMFLESIPLTPSGKTNRLALPKPDRLRPELETGYVAPKGELERRIAVIWQELLGIDQIGIYDDFFELGGHSLLATQLLSRINKMFNVTLPLKRIFEASTVKTIAVLIDTLMRSEINQNRMTNSAPEGRERIVI